MVRSTGWCALLVAASLIAAAASALAADAPRYALRFDAKSKHLAVRLCLAQAHAHVVFRTDSTWAMRFVSNLRRSSGADALTVGDGEWSAPHWRAGECLSYRADLAAIAAMHKQDVGWRLGDDLVTAPQLWLLRPDVQDAADATAAVQLPAGWSISVPWHRKPAVHVAQTKPVSPADTKARPDEMRFTIPHTPALWSSSVAIGRFREERIALPGGVLRLTILHGADAQQRDKLRTWLRHVSRAVLSAYGRLPVADVQVLMIPVDGHGSDGVLFGEHTRGEGNALLLLVNPARPSRDFMDDWIAVHELSHLMHPYLGDRGSWLAEGLATYYQNVLRGRAGLLTPAQAWDQLVDGFRRGAAESDDDDTLEQAATTMQKTHAYQRVYWSGAAYWLTVDRDLRRTSGGRLSVDEALSRFRDCCLPDTRGWKPQDFVARLDALLGVHVFSRRYRQFAALRGFPDVDKLYADLGIRHNTDGLTFNDSAPNADVRHAIMVTRAAVSEGARHGTGARRRAGGAE